MNNPLTCMNPRSWLSAARLRYRYLAAERSASDIYRRLYTMPEPAGRADLLDALAAFEDALAGLHTAIHGESGRDVAASRAGAADLLGMLARTERYLAAAEWTAAGDIRAGARVWHVDIGWSRISRVSDPIDPTFSMVCAMLGTTGPVMFWEPDDLIRTGGADITPADIGLVFDRDTMTAHELRLWTELAVTPDRAARADLVDQLADHAATRLGRRAGEVLADQADIERHLTAGASPVRMFAARRAIAGGFFLLGMALILPALGGPVMLAVPGTAAALVAAAANRRARTWLSARWDGVRYQARLLPRRRVAWRSWLRCKATGHRIGTAGHRHAHITGRRCRPSWVWWLPPAPPRTVTFVRVSGGSK